MSSTQRIIKFKSYSIEVELSIYKILKKKIHIKNKDIIKKRNNSDISKQTNKQKRNTKQAQNEF